MIRNASAINNAVNAIKNNQNLKVEEMKLKFHHFYNNILLYASEIEDAIDTFNYCKDKGLDKYLKDFLGIKKGKIVFEDNSLVFQYNEWKSENTGPYNWFVRTNGKEVYIRVDDNENNVPSMIADARYYEDGDRSRVIAPIYEFCGGNKRYTTHNAERPLSALIEFDILLPNFLDKFFTAVDNLGKN